MPATESRNQGKTDFVREVLRKNPRANARVVREEWAASGHDGTISQTLVNKQRSLMGLAGNIKGGRPKRSESTVVEKAPYTGKKRGRKPKSASLNGHGSTGAKGRSVARPGDLSRIEAEIDHLLFRVMGLGGLEKVEESLRQTRRLLYGASSGRRA